MDHVETNYWSLVTNDPAEIIWAAGFLEGEGSFLAQMKGDKLLAVVKASQVNKEPLMRLQEMFGGNIQTYDRSHENPNRKPISYWVVHGHRARLVIDRVLPHLSNLRQSQALHALGEVTCVCPTCGHIHTNGV